MALSPTIIGIGLATLDVLIRLEEMPTFERGGRFESIALDGGGPVGTALVAASRLGLSTAYLGTAGTDEMAERKLLSLKENGVDISRVVRREGPEKQIIICYVRQSDGERFFSGRQGLGDNPLTVDELDREFITGAKFLHLDGFQGDAALQAAAWAKEAGTTVVYDASKRNPKGKVGQHALDLLPHVDVLISGGGFVQALTGIEDTVEGCRKALTFGPGIAVQTEGEHGSCTVTADEAFRTPCFPVEVVDTTGAGDVFHGAYLVGLAHGWDLRRTATFASAVSAITCMHLGGRHGIPGMEMVEEFLKKRTC